MVRCSLYQGRHYPNWNGEAMWMGKPILDKNKNIKGLTMLHALIEGEHFSEWHGLIRASVYAINPLNLVHPDNTNSGRRDIAIPKTLPEGKEEEFLSHLINETDFNIELMSAFGEGISNTAELLGVMPEKSTNFWFAGFGVIDLYHDPETPEKCWERISQSYGVLDFLSETIATGELQTGIQASIKNEEVDLPPTQSGYTTSAKRALRAQVSDLAHSWGRGITREIDQVCSEGLIHECKRGNEQLPVKRGKLTTKELYLPRVKTWMEGGLESLTGIQAHKKSVENYLRLMEVFKGDGYSIEPKLNRFGDIVLQWRNGPDRSGEAVLSGDGAMYLDMDYIKTPANSRDHLNYTELKAQREFNANALSMFIEKGSLPE